MHNYINYLSAAFGDPCALSSLNDTLNTFLVVVRSLKDVPTLKLLHVLPRSKQFEICNALINNLYASEVKS